MKFSFFFFWLTLLSCVLIESFVCSYVLLTLDFTEVTFNYFLLKHSVRQIVLINHLFCTVMPQFIATRTCVTALVPLYLPFLLPPPLPLLRCQRLLPLLPDRWRVLVTSCEDPIMAFPSFGRVKQGKAISFALGLLGNEERVGFGRYFKRVKISKIWSLPKLWFS